MSLQHILDPEAYRLHYEMSWSLLISFVLCVRRSVGSVVISDTEESPSQERTSHAQVSPHRVQSSEISLTQCSWTNQSAWEAAVPHYLRSGTSPEWFDCCQTLRAVCTLCPMLVTVMGSPHRAPRRDACRISVQKAYQNWKKNHRWDCVLRGGILNLVTAHAEPWGRCSQGLWQEPTTGVTQCGDIPGARSQLCVSCGLGLLGCITWRHSTGHRHPFFSPGVWQKQIIAGSKMVSTSLLPLRETNHKRVNWN